MSFSLLRTADRLVTELWKATFWTAGGRGDAVIRWHTPGGLRVMVVAPHPDDEVAGCAGVILLHQQAGDAVSVVHVTDGRRSRASGLDPENTARQRREEARGSLATLGIPDSHWMGLPEGEWSDQVLTLELETIIKSRAPDILYAPSRIDFHPEHWKVARVLASLPSLSRISHVRQYQVHVPLTGVLVNLVAPLANVTTQARAASAHYVSQAGSLRGPWRLKAYAAKRHRVAVEAEEFWQLTPSAYSALHAEHPPRPLTKTFRGLRRRSLTDPLAFLVGMAERRRLRALANPS